MILKTLTICIILATAVATTGGERSARVEPLIGQNIADFTLADFRSKPCALSDWRDTKIIIVAFVGTECPIVKLYAQRLQKLADSYPTPQLMVIGIDSNQQDRPLGRSNLGRDDDRLSRHRRSTPSSPDGLADSVVDRS